MADAQGSLPIYFFIACFCVEDDSFAVRAIVSLGGKEIGCRVM